ncbi:KEOPS complex N(6)-L-threonylcarbamoyladenine synthase Kae1 [Caldivirga maquilingensis]|uniref:tRNA N6-adenosine threonylcarbamoyltransferase n=1 Tax=Caldivirga maquilingensis (strain ATCC 700844 / DSM 13496 / JCM 10307 / IC-167) TaxID=397948 RepID=KAE1_CALMQ|nr:KEOPS complex N(6)-L-threonylcarbamoyladenine synthase Kae1 [Caldivirga maquilingensis]A8MCC8.1 RecName: Full=tRNA N6-adenosine threonylcarbamoyltransferase; AltName: Full=N6-L-threonylcarbamoyladenine synthase; Short=t(6)A synthase; AltName: Full=t(6)A37 threonylcarbamoyladenosine biosynthesis protein Kae1; AltName: Full=tRNA threonylcarbamoyladenosine biosynthesis protein Kae1 [Caldivirga maquilingensis IC-167]ABW01434.1 putative metalloendopeptidase, glycoprotease family [Caldivirga maquili
MIILGIESTAHTIGVGIVNDNEVLANENETYTPPQGSGIHPREAADHHALKASHLVKRALDKAEVKLSDLDAVAFSQGPGLGPALRVGATVARFIAIKYGKPLVPVHHGVAHIEIAKMTTGAKDPLVLLVSGGHTMVTAYSGGRYRVFGETMDISVGNCLDMFARFLGLPNPGVPHLEECARRGKVMLELPYTVKGQDMSFAGLYTAAVKLVKEGRRVENVCLSIVNTAYYMLAEVTERALALLGKREIVIAGGVARSPILRSIMEIVASEYTATLHVVPPEYAGDNGAMIAWTGLLAYKSGVSISIEDSVIKQRWRIDEVPIPWITSTVS